MIHPRHWRSWLRARRYEYWMNVGAHELRRRASIRLHHPCTIGAHYGCVGDREI